MIPYFVSLLLIGLPLMWIEWTIGRFGGGFGHSTAPGMFHSMREKNRFIKYFGIIGILGPLMIFVYYTYIESWLLGYSFLALFGNYDHCTTPEQMGAFLNSYQGTSDAGPFEGYSTAYTLFALTFIVNISVVWRGLTEGIEKLCKLAMPILFLLAIVLVVRIFTLPAYEGRTVSQGVNYMWAPDYTKLSDPQIWFDAASQIFFTLSVGIGIILTYASYITKKDDVALSGLTAATTNEFTEVILGGSIVVPAAFLFLGQAQVEHFVQGDGGIFKLGFVAMPLAIEHMPYHNIFGFIWFFLLFIAGITSSISMAQPAVAFLEDEFDLSKSKAVSIFAVITFSLCNMVIFWNKHGSIDEFDFWAGKFFLLIFGLFEVILFAWIFGLDRSWSELHSGSHIRIPRFYRFVIKYVTPAMLIGILGYWFVTAGWRELLLQSVPESNSDSMPYRVYMRLTILALVTVFAFLISIAWRKNKQKEASKL